MATSSLLKNNVDSEKIDAQALHEVAEKACRHLNYKYGFYLAIYDIEAGEVKEAIQAMAADAISLTHCAEKIRAFREHAAGKIADPKFRGVVQVGNKIWSVAGKSSGNDEVICAYLALRFSPNIGPQEWITLSRKMVKNQRFVSLDKFFMNLGAQSVRYFEIDTN